MMRSAIGIFLVALLVGLAACEREQWSDVTVGLLGDGSDYASLYVLDDSYDALRLLAADSIGQGRSLHYRGCFERPQLAIVRLASDSIPYLFTLDEVPTLLRVGIVDDHRSMQILHGSDDNHAVVHRFVEVEQLTAQIDTLRRRYNRAVADTSLTAEREASLLAELHRADSLRTATLMTYIGSDRPVSYIFWRRFGYLLPADSVPLKFRK